MSYRSILVGLDADEFSPALLNLTVDLALRFDAILIGACAAEVPPPMVAADGTVFDGELYNLQREQLEERLEQCREQFQTLIGTSVVNEWRAAEYDPTRFLLSNARAADLLVVGSPASRGDFRSTNLASLLVGSGRPVLLPARENQRLQAETIFVAWKDTREARRAVNDALPFLKCSEETVVVTIGEDKKTAYSDSVAEVVGYLTRHGVRARGEVLRADGDPCDLLLGRVHEIGAEMIVSGAYGHSRLREWALGGVTRTLLKDSRFHRLMSC